MYKNVLSYLPANVVPAIVSIAMVYSFTRLLGPEQFGRYSFTFSAVLFVQASLFYAMQLSVIRLYPVAIRDKTEAPFIRTGYQAFAIVSAAAIIIAGLIFLAMRLSGEMRLVLLIGTCLLLARSMVAFNQAFNRASNWIFRYSAIECLHAVAGYGLGLLLILFVGRNDKSLLLGLLGAAILCAIIDIGRLIRAITQGHVDSDLRWRIVSFAAPLALAYFTSSVLQYADRLILGSLGGAVALGIYAVAYSLVERPTTLICLSITSATFPMAVHALENGGVEAARRQAGLNGALLLSFALPACFGLAFIAKPIAAVMVGPEFRAGVSQLIPILCFTALVRGFSSHFVDHAFHLSRRSDLNLAVYAPAAIATVTLSLITVPIWGAFGAAWSGLACQTGQLILSGFIARRVFPLWLPIKDIGKILLSLIPLLLVLYFPHYPVSLSGLLLMPAVGAATYGLAALALDLFGARTRLLEKMLRRNVAA